MYLELLTQFLKCGFGVIVFVTGLLSSLYGIYAAYRFRKKYTGLSIFVIIYLIIIGFIMMIGTVLLCNL